MLVHNITTALQISVAATGFALLCFGARRGPWRPSSASPSCARLSALVAAEASMPPVPHALLPQLLYGCVCHTTREGRWRSASRSLNLFADLEDVPTGCGSHHPRQRALPQS